MRGHRPEPPDSAQQLLTALGQLVDQALGQIKFQRARVEPAMALQRQMLPPGLPELPGLHFAARYMPSRDGLDVGGDWYDAHFSRESTSKPLPPQVESEGLPSAEARLLPGD
ncbi:hypothetical protein ACIQ7Q_10820 [Streptomyces sp. NPDC096176]|uniref:hypothetical protein n=1 Tax=Streptomyces sp. NPDC096176 TaxID=3366079 RepID=UPI0037FC9521